MAREITQSSDDFRAVARLDPDLADRLKLAVKTERRDLQAIVVIALTQYLKKYEKVMSDQQAA